MDLVDGKLLHVMTFNRANEVLFLQQCLIVQTRIQLELVLVLPKGSD